VVSHDVGPSREAFAAEWAVVRAWVDRIPADAYERPSVLDGWTVRDLVAHLGRAIAMLGATGVAPAGSKPLTYARYVGQYAANASEIADGTRALAAERSDDLGALLDESFDFAQRWLDEAGADGRRVMLAKRGPIRLDDLLRTRTLELVVHGDDLARSVPELEPPVHARGALKDVVKLLLDVLAERVPGRTVEVRVPPFAAVQVVEGASHTRGTPPNTVETDALTWIRVACGRSTWAGEVERGSVHASGTRAGDVGAHLPLL
jgi:uncharacterized protein (TIGR03083 family)